MALNTRKQERDYTAEVTALKSEVEQLAKFGKTQEAVEKITILEKQTRNAADMSSTSTLLTLLARLCWEAGDLDQLNNQLAVMSKKHGQLKEAVVRMVDEAMGWLPVLKEQKEVGKFEGGKDRWLELLKTLRDVTEGKIFLELQRARLTIMLAAHHETLAEIAPRETATDRAPSNIKAEGKEEIKIEPVTAKEHLDAAADLMSDLQAETYSSMDKQEKTEFILEQMRLESLRGNWVRVRVGSRKINRVYLKEKDVQEFKLRYYDLMVQLALQDDEYLEVCNAYQAVWDTEEIKSDPAKELSVIENIILYVILAPYNNEQHDIDLLKCFVTKELMRWPGIESIYGPTLRQSPIFTSDARWAQLHKRVVEHNVRTIASYYSRITMERLTQLLDLTPLTTERTLCKLVTDKSIYARIDRPAGIIDFRKKKDSNGVLNEWSGDLSKMLELVEKTSHLVSKEYAMHEAVKGKKIQA
nr:26S proteasome regulatory subunit N5 [Cryptococcus depauperatus CBS 7855]